MRRIWLVPACVMVILTSSLPDGALARSERHAPSRPSVATSHVTLCAASRTSSADLEKIARTVALRVRLGFGIRNAQVIRTGAGCVRLQAPSGRIGASVLGTLSQRGYLALTDGGSQPLPAGARVKIVCRKAGCAPHTPVGKTNLRARPPVMRIVVPDKYVQRGSARVGRDNAGYPTVTYSLRTPGAHVWCTYTGKHVQRYAAIVLDNRVLVDPMIQEAICGSDTQITGLASKAQAERIAIFLNYGPLPVGLRIISAQRLGAVS